jgi:hypothetical protein
MTVFFGRWCHVAFAATRSEPIVSGQIALTSVLAHKLNLWLVSSRYWLSVAKAHLQRLPRTARAERDL